MTEPEPRLIIHFSAIADGDQPLVGGKAYSLAELARSGAPVPPGFALTTRALEVFLAQGTIQAERERIEERIRKGDLSLKQSWELLGETRAKIVSSPLPVAVRSALVASYEGLLGPNVPVAVRSSGTKEDLEGASFAGQYETFLNVRGEEALIRAVKRCWASIWRNRVLQYAARRAGGALDLGMSVVVQEMVDAEVSGVLFTLNPLNGAENEVLIESVFGLGESLVSGKVDADRFCVDHQRKVVTERSIAAKALRIVALPPGEQEVSATGGVDYTREELLTGEAADAPSLDDAGLLELAELARCVQAHYGRPMDVEWVRAQDQTLFAVQARPITAISFPADFGEWTTADFKDGGVSSDVCSPLMWSLYEAALEQSMPGYFKEIGLLAPDYEAKWGRMVFARPYWNLAEVKAVLEKIPGYNERSFDADLGVAIPYEGEGKTTPTTLGGIARALPVLFKLNKSYKRVLAHDRSLKEEFEEKKAPFDRPAEEIARLTDAEFNQRFRELLGDLYLETETSYFTTIYNTSNSKLDFKVHFDKVNKLMGGGLDYPTLVSGLTDLAHLRPQIDMHARLGALRKAKAPVTDEVARSFADRWPHKSRKELDLRVPRWKDDLAFVKATLEQSLAGYREAADPRALAQKQHEAYERELARALEALRFRPLLKRSFRKGLERVRSYAWWREEIRNLSTWAYYLVRAWTLDAARRLIARNVLQTTDDAFMLRQEELLAALTGDLEIEAVRERVAAGHHLLRSFRNFDIPDEIGPRYSGGAAPMSPAELAALAEGSMVGLACSPGRVEGTAKVCLSLEDTQKVQPGDILVTRFTDPGWTPLFAMIAGVVTETGGLLAHAAVISREYGIPAVLALKGATKAIRDGDRVTVDGSRGIVEINSAS